MLLKHSLLFLLRVRNDLYRSAQRFEITIYVQQKYICIIDVIIFFTLPKIK